MAKVGMSCSISSLWMSIVPWMKSPSVSFQRRSKAWISRQYLGKRVISLATPSE
ncbi:hypothetical protein D3C87_1986000 [compost metagenome]